VGRSRSDDDDRSLLERATHDLLNPVSSLLGFGETIRARGASLGDDTIRQFGGSIARQAARLETAIHDLGIASRLLRRAPQPEPADLSLSTVLSAHASDRVHVEAPADLNVRADGDLLTDAIARLVANALEFSDGDVTIRAGRDHDVWIEIADTGTGFAPEALRGAFEPLTAGRNARNERGAGLGLGLFIARRFIEAQGGTLSATSAPGEGSVFRIMLPG